MKLRGANALSSDTPVIIVCRSGGYVMRCISLRNGWDVTGNSPRIAAEGQRLRNFPEQTRTVT